MATKKALDESLVIKVTPTASPPAPPAEAEPLAPALVVLPEVPSPQAASEAASPRAPATATRRRAAEVELGIFMV